MSRKKKEPDYVDVLVNLGRSRHRDLVLRAAWEGITPEELMLDALMQELRRYETPTASTGTGIMWIQLTI